MNKCILCGIEYEGENCPNCIIYINEFFLNHKLQYPKKYIKMMNIIKKQKISLQDDIWNDEKLNSFSKKDFNKKDWNETIEPAFMTLKLIEELKKRKMKVKRINKEII